MSKVKFTCSSCWLFIGWEDVTKELCRSGSGSGWIWIDEAVWASWIQRVNIYIRTNSEHVQTEQLTPTKDDLEGDFYKCWEMEMNGIECLSSSQADLEINVFDLLTSSWYISTNSSHVDSTADLWQIEVICRCSGGCLVRQGLDDTTFEC